MKHLTHRAAALMFAAALTGCDDNPPATTGGVTARPTPPTSASTSTPPKAPAPSTMASAATPEPPSRPLYYERLISEEDLEGRTLRELSLMRNTIYARAGNRFRRPWLHAHFSQQDWYAPKDEMDESKITQLDRDNAKMIAAHDSGIGKQRLARMRDELLARKKAGKPLAHDEVELSLLSQRLGTWLGDDNAPTTPLEDHQKLDRVLKVEELSTFSRRDLRILRNTIYARRGRSFDSKVVRSYFEKAAWYKPRADYHDGLLTGVDHKNIKIVRSVEDTLGGPEHENPAYGKDGWFFLA